jgi:hypothetical protein
MPNSQQGQPIDQWPARVAEWLASMGLVEAEGTRMPRQAN